ncbi:MAG TPA: phosphatidylserine decarboxylase [Candidatus Deferrimicrobium sp.]|nr:phosphatidylserine decarboxylase [Candidatus Deferrimicrobium sp.]
MKIVKEGLWVILPSAIVPTILILLTSWKLWALIYIFTAIMIFFFRDPNRIPPEVGVLSPADGKIIAIEDRPNELDFYVELSVVNCHLQRSPINGTVTKITKYSGRHRRFHLFTPKFGFARKKIRAATENERNVIEIQTENKKTIWLTQIVGAFARRLKSFVKEGQVLKKGDKVGLIYFGSMVKLQMEGKFELKVKKGDKVKAGETIIAIEKE